MFSVGWQVVHKTTSAISKFCYYYVKNWIIFCSLQNKKRVFDMQKKHPAAGYWSCSFSSPVTNLYALVAFEQFPSFASSKCKPYCLRSRSRSTFRRWRKNSRICSTFRFYAPSTFSSISPWNNPTVSTYYLKWPLKCICRSARISRTTLADYRRQLASSGTVLKPCPIFDWKFVLNLEKP